MLYLAIVNKVVRHCPLGWHDSTNADNETFCIVLLTSQVVMVLSSQPKCLEFESMCVPVCVCVCFFYLYSIRLRSFIIDVPRPLSNVLWAIIFQKVDALRVNEPVCLVQIRASKYYSIRNKTPGTSIINIVNIVTLQNVLFIYTCN